MSKENGRYIQWQLIRNQDGTYSNMDAHLGVLMDIREELEKLNQVLRCPNFLNLPKHIQQIERNTRRRKYVRKLRAVA